MIVTLEQLKKVMPGGTSLHVYIDHLNAAMQEFNIAGEQPVEMYLAQLATETGDLNTVSENLNYGAEGLANTWPTRYAVRDLTGKYILDERGRKKPNLLARKLHRNPIAIANNVYADRMGNGDEASGDGWNHRGGGGIQLTGKDNQGECAAYFGIPISEIGKWLRTPEGAMRSAAWFWDRAGATALAEQGNFDAVSDVINIGRRTARYGDAIGFHHRSTKWKAAQLAITPEDA